MKNDNDLILQRLRGIPMQKGTWRDKFDPRSERVTNADRVRGELRLEPGLARPRRLLLRASD